MENKMKYLMVGDPNDVASKKEVALVIKQIIETVKKVNSELRDEVKSANESNLGVVKDLKVELKTSLKELSTLVKDSIEEVKDKAYKDLNAEVYKLEKLIAEVPQFSPEQLEAKFGAVIQELENRLQERMDVLDVPIQSPEEIRDSLESLKDDERLDVSAIRGIDDFEGKLSNNIINRAIGIVDQRTSFLISKVNNLTATSSGVGTPTTPSSGTVDGNTTAFVFATKPTLLVSDGATLRENFGWTWSGSTATLSVAPEFDLFAL